MRQRAKMLKERKTSQVFLDAPKVFNKALSQNMPSFATVDSWAKVTGNPVDEARSLAGKSLLDDNGGSGALEIGLFGNVVTGTPTGCVRCSCLTTRLAGIRSVHQNVLEVSVVAIGNCSGCGKNCSDVWVDQQDDKIVQQDSSDSFIWQVVNSEPRESCPNCYWRAFDY